VPLPMLLPSLQWPDSIILGYIEVHHFSVLL
jgi:hypothetical protein